MKLLLDVLKANGEMYRHDAIETVVKKNVLQLNNLQFWKKAMEIVLRKNELLGPLLTYEKLKHLLSQEVDILL